MANPSTSMRESASRLLNRMRRSGENGIDIPIGSDEPPLTPRNNLVSMRAMRSEDQRWAWGFLSANDPKERTPEKIADALATVRADDAKWLRSVVAGETQLPPRVDPGRSTDDPALDEIRFQRTYGEVFQDVDLLREMPDDTLEAVHDRLRQAVDTPGAYFPRGGVESGRAVLAEVEREMKLRPKARALTGQAAYEAIEARTEAEDADVRIDAAAEVRRDAERWWGADPDNGQALDFLSTADRQYSRTVVEANPAWLENTLGAELDPSRGGLSAERDMLAEGIAHARFGREVLSEIDPGLSRVTDGPLLARIGEYRQAVGIISPGLGMQASEQGIGM